jgi:chlorobactene glucosyltransferase
MIILLAIIGCLLGVVLANILLWPKVRRGSPLEKKPEQGTVSILIPARNEESNLRPCLERALQQGGVVGEILIYDDHSTDRTPELIAEFARLDVRVRAVRPVPLEAGWVGKNFACAQLAAAAQREYLLFIDADARLADRAVEMLIAEMRERQLSFLSCWPGLEMASFWERMLMPMLNFIVFTIYPAPISLLSPRPSLGIAHGACLVFTRESYLRFQGHAAVRGEIFEDVRLAQLWRAQGARGLCLDGQELVRVRMYNSFDEIWRGFQKNFFPAFRREINFWLFILFRLIVFLAPFILLIFWPTAQVMPAVGGLLLMRALLAIYFHHPWWAIFLHPFSEAIVIALGLSSWRRCKSGRGVIWKGREYRKGNDENGPLKRELKT